MVEGITDFQQQIGIDETSIKQVIHVLTRASYLLRQPPSTSSLPSKFFFNKMSDMWCFLRGHVPEFENRKSVESIPCLTLRVSTPIPLTSIPRRTMYGICNLSLRNCPAKREQVEIGFQGQQQVLSAYNMSFVFIFFSLFDCFGSTNVLSCLCFLQP